MRCTYLVLALLALYPAQAQRFPVSARQQDLDYVATQIPKLHANFFYQLDPATFQQAAANLSARIGTLSDAEFYVQLTALISMAGDAHTTIYLSGGQAYNAGFQSFPLQLRWLDDGVFVTGAAAPYTRALGAQLVQVGGMPIADVVQKLGTIIPHENDQWLHFEAQTYLTGQQILQGLDIAPPGTTTTLGFRTADGTTFTLDGATSVAAVNPAVSPSTGVIPDYLTNSSIYYWAKYLPDERLVFFKYNVCEDDPANPFASFTTSLMAMLDQNAVDTLVIDFRGNTGGSTNFFHDLGSELVPRLPKLAANPKFRIYVVIDKGTFSSGMDDAMQFKSSDIPAELQTFGVNLDLSSIVVVAGEPTGGKPSHYGNVQPFTLPGSRLMGQYSTAFEIAPNGIPDGPSFVPDLPVNVRSTDYFARHDPVLAAIIARTTAAIQPPSGAAIAVSAASFRADQALAPGSLAAVFGAFSTTPDQVLINGTPAKLVSAARSQVNVIVPASAAAGRATVTVRAGSADLAGGQVTIAPAAPGIFVLNPADLSQAGAVENQDYSVNSSVAKAARGSVIQIFATGNGPLDASGAAPVTVMVGDSPAPVLYSAPVSQYPGLWQINAQLPASVTGQAPIYLIAGNLASNAVTIWIQ